MPLLLLALACTSGDKLPVDDTGGADDTGAPDSGDPGIDPRFQPLADAIEADLEANFATGASVAVWQDGEVVFARGFGTRSPDTDEPVATTTLFQIGSTTKMLTATALLQKVEAGALSLDDTLADALPELEYALDPTWNDAIRLHHLLSHTSGLADYVPWGGRSNDEQLAEFTYGDYADNLYAMNPPGQFWNYTNPGFTLAGLATQEADTRMWPDLLVEDVLRPLGMDRAVARKSQVSDDGDYALGYGYTDLTTGEMGTLSLRDTPDPAWARPAGMVWATPTEMLQVARFLMHGDTAVLSDALRAELTTEQVSLAYLPEVQGYGYGVFVDRGFALGDSWYEVPNWSHGGNTLSFTSTFHVVPSQDFAISILSNGYGDDFSGSVAAAFESLLELPAPSASPPDYAFDAAGLDAHTGAYLDAYNIGDVSITREGDTLFIDMPLLDELGYTYDRELVPISTDIWVLDLDGTPLDLSFLDGSDGTQSQFMRNRSFVATRVGDGAAAFAPRSHGHADAETVAAWIERVRRDPSTLASARLRAR